MARRQDRAHAEYTPLTAARDAAHMHQHDYEHLHQRLYDHNQQLQSQTHTHRQQCPIDASHTPAHAHAHDNDYRNAPSSVWSTIDCTPRLGPVSSLLCLQHAHATSSLGLVRDPQPHVSQSYVDDCATRSHRQHDQHSRHEPQKTSLGFIMNRRAASRAASTSTDISTSGLWRPPRQQSSQPPTPLTQPTSLVLPTLSHASRLAPPLALASRPTSHLPRASLASLPSTRRASASSPLALSATQTSVSPTWTRSATSSAAAVDQFRRVDQVSRVTDSVSRAARPLPPPQSLPLYRPPREALAWREHRQLAQTASQVSISSIRVKHEPAAFESTGLLRLPSPPRPPPTKNHARVGSTVASATDTSMTPNDRAATASAVQDDASAVQDDAAEVQDVAVVSDVAAANGSTAVPDANKGDKRRASKTATYEEKRRARACRIDDCTNYIINRGLCFRHGGGKQCSVDGCTSSAKNAGKCWKHGGSVKCLVDDCERRGKSRGFCWAHGGGTKCSSTACSKVAVSNGYCWAHGGGKRCAYDGCQKAAYERTYNYCLRHHDQLKDGSETLEV